MILRRLAFLVSALASLVPSASWADGGFNDNDTIDTLHPSWMSWIPDHVTLSQLSVPATHDTMALYGPSWDFLTLGIAGDITQTQSLSLLDQLVAGVRGLDIRGQLEEDGTLEIYHGPIYQHTNFGEVLFICNLFLDIFPTETIFMWMGENGTDVPDDPPINYQDAVYAYLNNPFLGRHVARETDIAKDNKNPSMGEMRGKIIMVPMQAWEPSIPDFYALNGDSNTDFQDNGTDEVNSLFEVDAKREAVLEHCLTANNDMSTELYRNTASGGGDLFPYSTANNVNPALARLLFSQNLRNKIGFINMDFPGPALIDAIIAHNLRFGPNLVMMKDDLDHIIDNLSQCLNDINKNDADERATHLRAYFRDKVPGHEWSVISCGTQGGDNWGFAIGHPDYWQRTSWDGGYAQLVLATPQTAGWITETALANYLTTSRLQGLSGNAYNRAQSLKALLDNQFPGMGWNVVVKKDPSPESFAHRISASVLHESLPILDEAGAHQYVVFAMTPTDSPPVVDPGGPYSFPEGTKAVLDASASYDPEGKELKFRWDLDGDGSWDTEFKAQSHITMDFPANPAPQVRMEVSDGRHQVIEQLEIEVTNVAPTIDVGGDINTFNDQPFARQCAFSDPGDDTWKVWVDYKDGLGFRQINHSNKQFTLSKTYSGHGTRVIDVRVEDETTSSTTSLVVNVVFPEPTILSFERTPIGDIPEGTTVTFSGTFYYEDFDQVTEPTALIFPDLFNVAGLIDVTNSVTSLGLDLYSFTGSYTYTDNLAGNAPNRANFSLDTSTPFPVTATLPVPIVNVAPTGPPANTVSAREGDVRNIFFDFDDPGDDTWTAVIDYGDGSPEQTVALNNTSVLTTHRFQDAGAHTVVATITDSDGASLTTTQQVNILNRALGTLDFPEANDVNEGEIMNFFVVLTGGYAPDVASVEIDWGDGTVTTDAKVSGTIPASIKASHLYRDDDGLSSHTITYTVRDDEGGEVQGSIMGIVSNVSPEITLGLDALVPSNGLFQHNVAFSDPGTDQWTARVNFGDGSGWKELGEVGISFPIEHTFPADGFYTVQVEVTDDDGGSQTESMRVLVGFPALELLPSAPGWAEVRWPITPLPFRLERSTNLMPDQWEEVPDEPQPFNGNNLLQRQMLWDQEFFRLAYP